MINKLLLLKKKKKYENTFKTIDGETVLQDLMAFCHYKDLTFVKGDMYHTAFNEGKRAVILRILSVLNLSEDKLMEIVNQEREHYE
jgi:hypothetical protein